MNGYVRAILTIPYGCLKLGAIKLFHWKDIRFGNLPRVSLNTEISVDNGGRLHIGRCFNMRGSARVRVRSSAKLLMGDNVSININCMVACHDCIEIGSGVQMGPNVQIYDHDHDFRAESGINAHKYKCSPVKIGNNVWIGANSVVLRGVSIGDNSVIAAGCIVTHDVPANTVLKQVRQDSYVKISIPTTEDMK